MKTEAEIKQIRKDLMEAHQWAIRNAPPGKAKIKSLEERIGLLDYILGIYDEN